MRHGRGAAGGRSRAGGHGSRLAAPPAHGRPAIRGPPPSAGPTLGGLPFKSAAGEVGSVLFELRSFFRADVVHVCKWETDRHYLFFIFFTTPLCSWFKSSRVTLQSASPGSAWRREARRVPPAGEPGRRLRPAAAAASPPCAPPPPILSRPRCLQLTLALTTYSINRERWAFVEAKDCPGSRWQRGRGPRARLRVSALLAAAGPPAPPPPPLLLACGCRQPRGRDRPRAWPPRNHQSLLLLADGGRGPEGVGAARPRPPGSAEAARLTPPRRRPLVHSSLF